MTKKNYVIYDNGKNPAKCTDSELLRKEYGYIHFVNKLYNFKVFRKQNDFRKNLN